MCIYNRLFKCLTQCNSITNNQYGFRSGHSTSHALLEFIHKVVDVFDKKEIMIGLFLDLSKALDTLDHSILLYKLSNYGIRGTLLEWFQSYLIDRKQYVEIDNIQSQQKSMRCGVPQGSILGPLLFIIYVNDMCNISDKLQFIKFADDTSVFMSHPQFDVLQDAFTNEVAKLIEWLQANKLVLNITKTNYMVFTNKFIDTDDLIINIDTSRILRVSHVKFLGVIIDDSLTWKEHTGVICNKI